MKFSKTNSKKSYGKKTFPKKVRTRDLYVVGSTPVSGQQLAIFTTHAQRWDIVLDSPTVEVRGSLGSDRSLNSYLEFHVTGYDRDKFVSALIVSDEQNADELIVRSLTVRDISTPSV